MSYLDGFIYKKALDACRASNSRLAKYLPPDDALLLSGKVDGYEIKHFDATAVEQFIEERYCESTNRLEQSKRQWLSDATYTFASLAQQLAEIFDPLVPQSPEYTIPYGCLMIIFKILVAKQEKKEKVIAVFESLRQKLPFLGLYDVLFPTDQMRAQLAKTYLDVLDLIVCVTEYCAIGRIAKLVDVTSLKPKYDFEEGLQRVEHSYRTLKDLAESASLAVLKDTHEILKDQSRMIDSIADQSRSMVANISALTQAVDTLQLGYSKIHHAQTRNWSDSLINAILPDTETEWEELIMWQSREFRLSPKEHWEVNGMLDYLQEWYQLEPASILAIFGPAEDRDTWVTEFSMDMIQAFQVQDVLVASAMCDRPADQIFTPTMVIRKLICQLLEQMPELTIEAPDIFNLRVFRKTINFHQACRLFSSVVARLTTPFAIIVDRIDCCEADIDDSDQSQDLVGFLSEVLAEHEKRVKIIITSAEEPPEDGDLPSELAVSICAIKTRKRPLRKEGYYGRTRITGREPTFYFEFLRNTDDDWEELRAVGAEQLYKLRWVLQRARVQWDIYWDKELKPRTAREKKIYRYFHLEAEPTWGRTVANGPDGVTWTYYRFGRHVMAFSSSAW
ncbi:uncharacterized protein Z519_01268 [Cladophialophora bantiana CBS 173.52]|uniref:NACHT domain-containing protein n=1 Tax=Cladophialophora bantiana (strain ATCC 10958 / CBS 173.52 / CDC B-1940 / NIH 8579) TaxID=1442370 RepID=A0A0D2ILK8_CLAB1|nr:uncharacterized protein Z519_01268 [Cladophialophora bantiana CBS 173.52]KIW97684.1 hypothetical protein Z519_01268 [Cladophialophora bantiana CBS 173.52]